MLMIAGTAANTLSVASWEKRSPDRISTQTMPLSARSGASPAADWRASSLASPHILGKKEEGERITAVVLSLFSNLAMSPGLRASQDRWVLRALKDAVMLCLMGVVGGAN